MQGIEGVKGVYQAIHAEWFRYTYVLLYWIFSGTVPIYIWYSMIFYAPMLYFALIAHPNDKDVWKQVLLFALLFVLFPGVINTLTFDMRPRALYFAAWSLVILAIFYRRPFWEKLIFFCLLIGLREEGILFGLVVLAFNFVRMHDQKGRWKQTLVLLGLDVAAFGVFMLFMSWGGYIQSNRILGTQQIVADQLAPYPLFLPIAVAALALLVLLCVFFWFKRRDQFVNMLLVLVYCGGLFFTGFQFYRDLAGEGVLWDGLAASSSPLAYFIGYVGPWEAFAQVYYLSMLLAVVLLWNFMRGRSRTILQWILVALCVLLPIVTISSAVPRMELWMGRVQPAELVWNFKSSHDRYKTKVLVDYATFQAFYNYENVYVYNRLPVWVVEPQERFTFQEADMYYPVNQKFVVKLVKETVEYAVISKDSLADMQEVTKLAGVPATVIASNDQFIILKLR